MLQTLNKIYSPNIFVWFGRCALFYFLFVYVFAGLSLRHFIYASIVYFAINIAISVLLNLYRRLRSDRNSLTN